MTCAIDGCTAPIRARGWCASHYARNRRHGDPTSTGQLRLPAAPLVNYLTTRHDDLGRRAIAELCDVSFGMARDWFTRGTTLTVDTADRVACRLGCLPFEIWHDWYEVVG